MDIAHYRETPVTANPVFFNRGIVGALYVFDQQHAIALGEAAEYVQSFPYNNVLTVRLFLLEFCEFIIYCIFLC